MHIAVVGAGLAGLATAWHLAEKHQVTLFDAEGIGGAASGVAAGLLHPYAGLHVKRNWRGREGFDAALQLLDIASKALGQPVYKVSGLIRLAMTVQALGDYRKAAELYEDVEWLTEEETQARLPGCAYKPGILVHSAVTVEGALYLEGLWKACREKGVTYVQEAISDLQQLNRFERICLTTGAGSLDFTDLHLSLVKGQLIELEWPDSLPPLLYPISSQAYILMTSDNKRCVVGATFEHAFANDEPNPILATQELLPKAIALLPFLKDAKVVDVRAGIRVSTPDHRPILKEIAPRCWLFTGLGSKGLLYHVLFARELADKI